MHFRLIKPDWAKPEIKGKPNPSFVREIAGPNVLGDKEFSEKFVRERNEEGYNVYWFPNGPSKSPEYFLNGRDIDCFDWVFVDMDLKDQVYKNKHEFYDKLKEFPIQPTVVIDSGNGVHAYWRIKDLDRISYMISQFRLIQHFNTDESIWTPLQLMRSWEYKNTKKADEFKQVLMIEGLCSGQEYNYQDLWDHLPEITPDNARKVTEHNDKLEGKTSVDLDKHTELNPDELPPRFVALMDEIQQIADLFTHPKETAGDRSSADMRLVNLLWNRGFSRDEIFAVAYNTQKAKSRSESSRFTYAQNMVEKVFNDRIDPEDDEGTLADFLENEDPDKLLGAPVSGSSYFDCLHGRWRKKEALGLIAGPGVGKTSWTLINIRDMILNNPNNDDIYFFYSLEMPKGQIAKRWLSLVKNHPELSKRLYVITNEDRFGKRRKMGLQDIYRKCRNISGKVNKKIGAVAIDHIGVMSKKIYLNVEPNFGAEDEIAGGNGKIRILTPGSMAAKMKDLAVMLDTFVIVQSQTTKGKALNGDVPLELGAAYGSAEFEWYMDYVITVWQPLRTLYDETDLRIMAWQYCKIREAHPKDGVKLLQMKTLNFDTETGEIRSLTQKEVESFRVLRNKIVEQRKEKAKKGGGDTEVYHHDVVRNFKLLLGEKEE